jgi:HEPN domain-containing protein
VPDKAAIVRKFIRAAKQRFTTAEFLLRHGEGCNIDAQYLAGYGVECALKALILARTSRRQFAATLQRLTGGRKTHDYEMLKGILEAV